MIASRFTWGHLNKQRVGRYAEYYVKMAATMAGLDVYTPEVDDRGLDFVVRAGPGRFYEFQVKAVRSLSSYIFMRKEYFIPTADLHLALVLMLEGSEPAIYLIPSTVGLDPAPPFVSRDYGGGLKSPPEWGLNLSNAALVALEPYRFEKVVARL